MGNRSLSNLARAYAIYRALFGEVEDLIKGKSLLGPCRPDRSRNSRFRPLSQRFPKTFHTGNVSVKSAFLAPS